ncbi:MAG: response regulator transcription factor [Saprospiraceae bacterium]|nr:response regulator transcription factor [Saprospiraceae bacterium]
MIDYLIVEDEMIASQRLVRMLKEIDPQMENAGIFESVEEVANYLLTHAHPQIIFMDIQVADGNSFELFKIMDIQSKVIFTTAYSEFAVNAFRQNAIDYLLKPVKKEELMEAIGRISMKSSVKNLEMAPGITEVKGRFLIKFGNKLTVVKTQDIAYIYSEYKIGYFVQNNGLKVASDYKLQDLEAMLDPKQFFRVNRQFIVQMDTIQQMSTYSKARINLKLNPEFKGDIIVSTEKTPEFKEWIRGKG